MNEDLYNGKVTIRQIRQSYVPIFPMKDIWVRVKAQGGPGIVEDKNYLICPSSAFCNAVATASDQHIHMIMGVWNEYCRRYPLTMLIQD